MIFPEIHNRAIEDLLLIRFQNAKQGLKYEKFNYILADFDGVVYRVHSLPNDKSKLIVSIYLSYFKELQEFRANDVLKKEYGPHLCSEPETDCSISLIYDLANLPYDLPSLAHQASLLKRNCLASVFERLFEFQASEGAIGFKQAVIHYRSDETLYIQAQPDRVTVIFSTLFKDPGDAILGKVFMQELTEVRRRIDRAPQALCSYGTPPAELKDTDAVVGDNVAYITFVLFPRHLTPTAAPRTINLMYSLRNYLHYHIKCAKGYVHRRMRTKATEFVKILNRARPQYSTVPVIQLSVLPSRFPSTTSFASLYSSEGDGDLADATSPNGMSKETSPELPCVPDFTAMNGYV
ncbi:unnamed protein product [Dicrocoelium dendriticum]|nr:unnamed protein product [Dicrocoelium dendriticum]